MSNSKPFSNNWGTQWGSYVNKLRLAIKSNCSETDLHRLIAECRNMYEEQLCVSSVDQALAVISGYGCSALEIAFMWMGRWRPTSAVVLVYSTTTVVNLKGRNEFEDIVGKEFIDSIPLNEKQRSGLNALQKHASAAEADISQQLAMIQMLLIEQDTVAALRLGETCSVEINDMSDFQLLIDAKLKELQVLLEKADMLRLHTLRVLLDLLSPVQAAVCIVAAYELILALRSLSKSFWNPEG